MYLNWDFTFYSFLLFNELAFQEHDIHGNCIKVVLELNVTVLSVGKIIRIQEPEPLENSKDFISDEDDSLSD